MTCMQAYIITNLVASVAAQRPVRCRRRWKPSGQITGATTRTATTTTTGMFTTPRRNVNTLVRLWTLLAVLRRAMAFSLLRRPPHYPIGGVVLTPLLSSMGANNEIESPLSNDYLMQTLESYGYANRLLTIESTDLPVVAELHHDGQWSLGLITSFQLPTKPASPPRVQVQFNGSSIVMDLGQITFIWMGTSKIAPDWKNKVQLITDSFPMRHTDQAMQKLYFTLAKHKTGGITKKDLTDLIQRAPEQDRQQTEEVFRRLVKTGDSMRRLVDCDVAADYLFDDSCLTLSQRAVAAHVLAKDAELGGRFKRWPCVLISFQSEAKATHADHHVTLSLINGGWLLLDKSVRAGTEARKFVERTDGPLRTLADERIAYRLECLAMGQIFESTNKTDDDSEIELDVRETLKAMQLPLSPAGASEALVRIGRWSKDTKSVKLQPWSTETLDAAKWYGIMDAERRLRLKDARSSEIEGRSDLRNIPCVCIDKRRTVFRDDAIAIRPRSMTGRKVIPGAFKAELLIHITDTSDIYTSDTETQQCSLLREAATKRGMSRYDLPLGPLHLMPPTALRAMSFTTNNVGPDTTPSKMTTGVNRCVTIWVYVDEKTGRILDAGIERTLIPNPVSLSFEEANQLFETNPGLEPRHPLMIARAVISAADQILARWASYQAENSPSAIKREKNLVVRELVAREQYSSFQGRPDDAHGFTMSRGHQLVNRALEIHGFTLLGLLRRSKAPVPMASGAKDGRIGTAPLRRFVDGMQQRQAISVLCSFGGPSLTAGDCQAINQKMDEARNNLLNLSVTKSPRVAPSQVKSLRALQSYLVDNRFRVLSALSTGIENKVTIKGIGAIAKCRGVTGTLKPGVQVNVIVDKIVPEKGILVVSLVST